MPIVLGSEGAGVVEGGGEGVTAVKAGDDAVCSWNPHCGHCFYCERDQPILCEPFTFHQPRGHLLDGKSRLSCGAAKVHHFGHRMPSTPPCPSRPRSSGRRTSRPTPPPRSPP